MESAMQGLKGRLGQLFTGWFSREANPVRVEIGRELPADSHARTATQVHTGETWPSKIIRFGRRKSEVTRIDRGLSEMLDVMQALRAHMDQQATRSQRMLELVEQLSHLPESQIQQERLLGTLHEQLTSHTRLSERMADSLGSLSRAASTHDQTINAMSKQMQSGQDRMLEGISSLYGSLGELDARHQTSANALRQLSEQLRNSEQVSREMFQQSQKQVVVLTIACGGLAALALAVAGYVAFFR